MQIDILRQIKCFHRPRIKLSRPLHVAGDEIRIGNERRKIAVHHAITNLGQIAALICLPFRGLFGARSRARSTYRQSNRRAPRASAPRHRPMPLRRHSDRRRQCTASPNGQLPQQANHARVPCRRSSAIAVRSRRGPNRAWPEQMLRGFKESHEIVITMLPVFNPSAGGPITACVFKLRHGCPRQFERFRCGDNLAGILLRF